ncbi:MAG TPA: polymer-forming cytoskeletal protein [Symbiobacteriaceae bacterium]|nr:polymer-forming cytoskeletal protein [Symbiobacteriaceae bacterium]
MRKLLIGLLVILTMVFAIVPVASAVDLRQGTTRETVEKNETVDDDLLMFGDSVTIEGTVNGDVFAFANSVFVRGTINGNLITAASRVEVDGAVAGTVFAAGSSVTVNGRIDRSLVAAGSRVILDSKGTVGHSLIAGADRIDVLGSTGRGMAAGAATIEINGKIGRELKTYSNNLRILSNATVAGPVAHTGEREAFIDPAAKTGPVTYTFAQVEWDHNTTFWVGEWWKVISFISFLACGLLILALFPGLRRTFPQLVLEKPWQLPLTGIVTLVVLPIAAILLIATVIGIPVSLLSLLALPLLMYVGQILVSYAVGKLLGDRVPFMANWNWTALFLVGAILTTAVVSVPGAGWLFGTAFVLYGFGGVLWMLFARQRTA